MFEITVIVGLVVALGQVAKQFVPKQYMPLISLALGIGAGFGFVDGSLQEQLFYGLAIGTSASGAFDISKVTKKNPSASKRSKGKVGEPAAKPRKTVKGK